MMSDSAGVKEMAAWLAQHRQWVASSDPIERSRYSAVLKGYHKLSGEARNLDPSQGMGGGEKFLAGVQKSYADTGRGIGQVVGAVDQGAADEAERRDAPLMDSWQGTAGNVVGNVSQMFVPGGMLGLFGKAANMPRVARAGKEVMAPTTIPSAAAQGAAFGLVQPTTTDGPTRAGNTLMGGLLGGAIPTGIGAARVGKAALVDPFTVGGKERLAGNALERFATNPDAILNARMPSTAIPGSVPTLAEIVNDTGVSQLQRALINRPESGAAITDRLAANNAARVKAIEGMAGDATLRDMLAADRAVVTEPLYKQAFAQMAHDTPWVKGQITQLQKRPAFIKAWADAETIAANQGIKMDPENVTQVAHFAKMALDDEIERAVSSKMGSAYVKGLRDTKTKLVMLMESGRFAPGYKEARETYRAMSRPINQMEIAQEFLNALRPAQGDFGELAKVNAASFAKALRNGDRTAARATEYAGSKLADVMDPAQMQTLNTVAGELTNATRAAEQGMARGSPTAQNLVSDNVLRQILGPFGMPQSWAEATLPSMVTRAGSVIYKPAEERVIALLAEGAIDLQTAQRLLRKARSDPAAARLINSIAPTAVPITTGATFALSSK